MTQLIHTIWNIPHYGVARTHWLWFRQRQNGCVVAVGVFSSHKNIEGSTRFHYRLLSSIN